MACPPEHVLVPVDLSHASRAGLRVGGDLARRFDAGLTVLHVESLTAGVMPGTTEEFGRALERHAASIRGMTEAFCAETLSDGPPAEITVVRSEHVGDAIAEHAGHGSARWICMSSAGSRGWERGHVGSVTSRVVRVSTVPVLSYRSYDSHAFKYDWFRRVLVAADFSAGSRELIEHGACLAGPSGQLVLMHAIESAPLTGYGDRTLAVPKQDLAAAEAWAKGKLFDLARELVEDVDPDVVREPRIVVGRAGERILAMQAELRPDVTVIGTHGRTGVDPTVLGSVAEQVVRHASGPVLVVPGRAAGAAGETR